MNIGGMGPNLVANQTSGPGSMSVSANSGFNHLPKFVNERSQYVSPYHSDSAVSNDSSHSRKQKFRNSTNNNNVSLPPMHTMNGSFTAVPNHLHHQQQQLQSPYNPQSLPHHNQQQQQQQPPHLFNNAMIPELFQQPPHPVPSSINQLPPPQPQMTPSFTRPGMPNNHSDSTLVQQYNFQQQPPPPQMNQNGFNQISPQSQNSFPALPSLPPANQYPPQQAPPPPQQHPQQPSIDSMLSNNSFIQPNSSTNGANPHQQFMPPYSSSHKQKSSKKHKNKYRPSNCQSDSEILEKSTTRSVGGGSSVSVGGSGKRHGTKNGHYNPNAAQSSSIGGGGNGGTDNWDKDTVITDVTSNKSSSVENLPLTIDANGQMIGSNDDFFGSQYSRNIGCCDVCLKPSAQIIFVFFSMLTPVAFVILPRVLWINGECSLNCIGSLLNLSFRLLVLFLALWAIFFRKSRATLPSLDLWKGFLFVITATVIAVAWTFYSIKILLTQLDDYDYILSFALSVSDCLIFIHYLAVLVLEIKHMRKEYIIKVVRNTDGESKFYSVGHMSLQNCASLVLEKYYKDFPVYNPYLMTIPGKGKSITAGGSNSVSQFKLYNIDGVGNETGSVMENSKAMIAASARNRDSGRNTRFYEEQDFERRLRKRRARLVVAVEEAFMHIKRPEPSDKDEQPVPMDAEEAAEAIFPSMARALQKYLKISRQAHCYSLVAIKDHLARCITLDFTPRAFLEKYLTPGPVITSEVEQKPFQNWELITDTLVNRSIHEGLVFQLKQENTLSLVIYVAKLPRFHIKEEAMDQNQGRFVLRLQSETSV